MSDTSKTKAIEDVLAERRRQIEAEGFDAAHDDEWQHGEIARAAVCYALIGGTRDRSSWNGEIPRFWPWADKWWKPTDRRRDLVKAGALVLAEIERIDRLLAKKGGFDD